MTQFTVYRYVYDRLPVIVAIAFVIAIHTAILIILTLPTEAIIVIDVLTVCAAVCCFTWDYLRQASYWRKTQGLIDTLGRAEFFLSLVDEPHFLEGRISFEQVSDLIRMNTAETQSIKQAYATEQNYLELWVHEVKTPVATAKLILSSMHNSQATKLKIELERIEVLLDQVLYSMRASSLHEDYFICEINLAQAIRDACKNNMQLLVAKGVSLNIDIPDDLTVLGDRPWVIFVISQAVVNAAKYDATSLHFTSKELKPDTPQGKTLLCLQDNGCGIPAADMPRVFERGFTGSVGRAHGSATGMGLYLSAVLCDRMGVGIALASEEGHGTRLELTFPHDRRSLHRIRS